MNFRAALRYIAEYYHGGPLHEWMPYYTFSNVRVADSIVSGPVMRRKIRGAWQYRKMTSEEMRGYRCDQAW